MLRWEDCLGFRSTTSRAKDQESWKLFRCGSWLLWFTPCVGLCDPALAFPGSCAEVALSTKRGPGLILKLRGGIPRRGKGCCKTCSLEPEGTCL